MRQLKILIFTICFLFPTLAFGASQQVSSTTTETIIDNARAYLNQEDVSGVTPFCTDAQMLVWLNDGMKDLTTLGLSGQTTELKTLVANTVEYSISASYTKVIAVRYIDEDSHEKGLKDGNVWSVGHTQSDLSDSTDKEPTHWYEWAGNVGIYPALGSVSGTTNETVRLYMVLRPTALTSGTTVTTPAIYDKALTLYVAAQAFLKARDFDKAAFLMDLYYRELGITRQDLNTQPIKSQEIIDK